MRSALVLIAGLFVVLLLGSVAAVVVSTEAQAPRSWTSILEE